MWWQPSHTRLESSGGSRLRQVVTQDVLCVQTHVHTHTLCFFSSLFFCRSFEQRHTGKGRNKRVREWRWESSQTSTPAATTAVSHRVFGCFCECVCVCEHLWMCVCVCTQARVLGVFHRIANTSPRSESPIGTETSVEWKDASLHGRLWRKEKLGRGEEKRVNRSSKPCLSADN